MTDDRLESVADAQEWLLDVIEKFIVEDSVMRRLDCTSEEFALHREAHNQAHADLSAEILELISVLDSGALDNMNKRVRPFVDGRLRQHAAGLDAALKKFQDDSAG